MNSYTIFLHLHSVLRWLLLISMLYMIINAFIKWRRSAAFTGMDSVMTRLTVTLGHIQFLLGILLFFISPKVHFSSATMSSPILRFFTVEHSLMMILAVVFLTIGGASARKALDNKTKAKRVFIWFLVALIVILAAIPWPSRNLGSGWI